MTHDQRRDEAAGTHGREKAMPMIRSMYPSESRGVMALHFQRSFEAGADWGRADAIAEVLELIRSSDGRRVFIDNSHGVAVDLLESRIKRREEGE